ncbi:MAG: GrpB family protein [Paenibacillaceae bacterium]|nr:GrpB family protein [Paenibacillaceae bacterium]
MRKTTIAVWTEKWDEMYSVESKEVRRIFGDDILDIYHIGSTSVPTIGYAKPIIDILVVVRDINVVDSYHDDMAKLGYSPRGEQGIEGRRYFTKGGYNRTHHVHMYAADNINIKKHLDFKNYLFAHPEEAQKYGELKISLAEQFPDDTHKYQEGKESFVNELVAKATKWASNKPINQEEIK